MLVSHGARDSRLSRVLKRRQLRLQRVQRGLAFGEEGGEPTDIVGDAPSRLALRLLEHPRVHLELLYARRDEATVGLKQLRAARWRLDSKRAR